MITVTTATGSHALDKGILSCPAAPFEQVTVTEGNCSACGDALTVPDMAAAWAVVVKHNLTFRELDVLGVPSELRDNLVACVSGLPVSHKCPNFSAGLPARCPDCGADNSRS